jgi:hypothetical protein
MTAPDYERLLKLVNMLGSDNSGEVSNATTAINRLLNAHGLAWSDIILPRKLLPVRANAPEEAEDSATEAGPPPLGQATPQQMYDYLMASANVSPETKRDVREIGSKIKAGPLTPAVRGELQTMYNYAVLRRVPI